MGNRLFEETGKVRRMAPDTAMIILSPNTNVRTKIRLLELGADDYIEEPFDPLELLARVRSFVRRQGSGKTQAGGEE